MSRVSLWLLVGVAVIASVTCQDNITVTEATPDTTQPAEAEAGESTTPKPNTDEQKAILKKAMELKCYVCNSHKDIDKDDCASSDLEKLKKFLVNCNLGEDESFNGKNNQFLTKVYGTLKNGYEVDITGKEGWFKTFGNGTDDSGMVPGHLSIPHFSFRTQLRIGKDDNLTRVYKQPFYDECRKLSIQTPETSLAGGKKMAAIKDNPRIIRTCGILSQAGDGDVKDKCKDYRARGGATTSCSCQAKDGKPCNGGLTVTASKFVLASLGLLYIILF